MENLIRLLLILTTRAQFNSESERDEALDFLRGFADSVLSEPSMVPTKPGEMNPAPPAPDVDPGVMAEPVPPDEQAPPPVSPELAGATESNAFGT
jgi:hypothetical protein